ncbi:MAG: ABC transporter substrate-binding protein [Inquilinus sp.]|nr:ABC transporter substrate-binding protein [Inquilinus sp.]
MISRVCMAAAALATAALVAVPAGAAEEDWQQVLDRARGQTVYFNAWGGSQQINDYIAWVADRVERLYGVELRHTKVSDTADVVSRILAEKTAGRAQGGSVDLVWINGENFAAMRRNALLGAPFAEDLPNFAFVDTAGKPTTLVDFTVPTSGLESPWGMAQLVFIHDTARLAKPPRDLAALLDHLAANPGRFTYPLPPDFLGTTFLKQALVGLVAEPDRLQHPSDEDFAEVTAPLWAYLDRLHPLLWRGGEAFAPSGASLIQLLDDGEVDIAFTFNPGAASAAIENGELPDTARTFVLKGGTLGNTHFVAIPFNSGARDAAMVVANFLLSPEAQLRKEDPRIWGDPTVLAMDRLPADDRIAFAALPRGIATLPPEALGTPILEPHASWTDALEAEWQRRYGR